MVGKAQPELGIRAELLEQPRGALVDIDAEVVLLSVPHGVFHVPEKEAEFAAWNAPANRAHIIAVEGGAVVIGAELLE